MKRFITLLVCISALSLQAAQQPNILVVMLDDFGTGQFAPVARQLNVADVDPAFLAYSAALDESYDPQVALEPLGRYAHEAWISTIRFTFNHSAESVGLYGK